MKRMIDVLNTKLDLLRSERKFNKVLFLALFCVILLVGFKVTCLDYLALLFLLLITLFLKPEEILYSYIFLFFFEPVTEVSLLGGSINRLVTIIGILRIIYCFFKDKVKIKKIYLLITIFLSFFLVYSLYINRGYFKENILLYSNIMIFVLYGNYLSSYKFYKKKRVVNELLETIVCGVFGSILYGFIFWNFDLEQRAGFTNWRFNGTNDPNFLAYYINLAIIIQMFRKKIIEKKDKIMNIVINVLLVVGLILTKSITGIFINIISFIALLLIKNKEVVKNYICANKRKVILACTLLVVLIGLGTFIVIKKNINEVYTDNSGKIVAKNRIADIILSVKQGDVDRLTSQKTRDWRLFLDDYYNSDFTVLLFGKSMQPINLYSPYWGREVASHSTYIDFLCCFGMLGMAFILWYLLYKIKYSLIMSSCISNDAYKFIRIILLVYGLELGIYTNRIFLLMFIL